ncbi:MAG: di-heme oxidoredictase family protein [Rubripirellula sp.]
MQRAKLQRLPIRFSLAIAMIVAWAFVDVGSTSAESPDFIQQGRELFERNWPVGNPAFGGDGLGPLFNGQSCVACHHQKGTGGGGDAPFNAKTVGIEQMRVVGGLVTDDVIATMVRSFHPGFIQADGTIANTLPLSHHGGSSAFIQANHALFSRVPAEFSSFGGPLNSEETRLANATPILFSNKIGRYEIALKARVFQRNTTALYGSGLIDQVTDRQLDQLVLAQKRHPEISGRPSTLDDGRYGKFGWRANIATLLEFNDQACANEVGLETRRKPQPLDPTVPQYRNPSIDITDQQIRAMTSFVAALPKPIRRSPDDSRTRLAAQRGEQLFGSIGCSVCHVPSVGAATDVYSDLLLHDMGYESMDLNFAEPYRVKASPIVMTSSTTTTNSRSTNYYGQTSTMSSSQSSGSSPSSRDRRPSSGYAFQAPTQPQRFSFTDLGSKTETFTDVDSTETDITTSRRSGTATTVTERSTTVTKSVVIKVTYEPTMFNQEWRTAPLWGVKDSAPYMHDGRAETLLEAISMHEGESIGTRDRFLLLSYADRQAVIAFLETLVAPPNAPQPAM